MNTVIAFVKSHWTIIVAIIGAVWGVVGMQIQAFVAMHPGWTSIIAVVAAILAHLSPSPQSFWKGEHA